MPSVPTSSKAFLSPHILICRLHSSLTGEGQGKFILSDAYQFPLPPDKSPLALLDCKKLALNRRGPFMLGGIQAERILVHRHRLPIHNIENLRRPAPIQLTLIHVIPMQIRAQFLKASPTRSSGRWRTSTTLGRLISRWALMPTQDAVHLQPFQDFYHAIVQVQNKGQLLYTTVQAISSCTSFVRQDSPHDSPSCPSTCCSPRLFLSVGDDELTSERSST
jgi:hypothetical protein